MIALWSQSESHLYGKYADQAGLAYEYLRSAGDRDDLAMTERMLKEVRATVQMPEGA